MTESKIMEIPANLLVIDPEVQRNADHRRVATTMAPYYRDELLGVLAVSSRPDGMFDVRDGQHRLLMIRLVFGENTGKMLWCVAHFDLTTEQKASLFLGLNNTKSVARQDKFRLALVAGEEWAVHIYSISTSYGWLASGIKTQDDSFRRYSTISAVEKIYRLDNGATLTWVMSTTREAWGQDKSVMSAEILHGLGNLRFKHREIDGASLVRNLAKISPLTFIANVQNMKRMIPGNATLARAAYLEAVAFYNNHRRTRRIESSW